MKYIHKGGHLALDEDEYKIFIQILSSLPDNAITLSDLLSVQKEDNLYYVTPAIIKALKNKEISGAKPQWKDVLAKFNRFVETDEICL